MLYFVLGFVSCFVLFLVAYAVVRELIFRKGSQIITAVENELGRLIDKSVNSAAIIYPEVEKEAFLNDDELSIDKLLKN